jgi:hypothetical protein
MKLRSLTLKPGLGTIFSYDDFRDLQQSLSPSPRGAIMRPYLPGDIAVFDFQYDDDIDLELNYVPRLTVTNTNTRLYRVD